MADRRLQFELRAESDGVIVTDVSADARYSVGFASKSEKPPLEVGEGSWVVGFFPSWNAHDFAPISEAICFVKGLAGRVSLGVQSYSELSEVMTWLRGAGVPEAAMSSTSEPLLTTQVSGGGGRPTTLHIGSDPAKTLVWVALRDGVVREIRQGVRTPEDIKAMIDEMFPAEA